MQPWSSRFPRSKLAADRTACFSGLRATAVRLHSGTARRLETNYTEWLSHLATNRCRFLIRDVVEQKPYQEKAAEGNYSFLRTNAFYEKCMDLARKNWKWEKTRLK